MGLIFFFFFFFAGKKEKNAKQKEEAKAIRGDGWNSSVIIRLDKGCRLLAPASFFKIKKTTKYLICRLHFSIRLFYFVFLPV